MIAANANASTDAYSALQKKSAEVVERRGAHRAVPGPRHRPDFASTVMIPSLQAFLKNPDDIDGLTASIQEQKVSIFGVDGSGSMRRSLPTTRMRGAPMSTTQQTQTSRGGSASPTTQRRRNRSASPTGSWWS